MSAFCFSNPRFQTQPQRERELEYDRDLKKNGGYEYTTDQRGNKEHKASSAAGSSNQRDGQGRDAKGRDAKGRDANGRDAKGRDAKGRDANGRDAKGRDGHGGRGDGARGTRGAADGNGMGSLDDDLARFMGKGKDGAEADKLHKLAAEIHGLDEWSEGVDPYEFVTTPQRFPHADGADLGDNYVGGLSGLGFRVSDFMV